jgi:hypothetical protein
MRFDNVSDTLGHSITSLHVNYGHINAGAGQALKVIAKSKVNTVTLKSGVKRPGVHGLSPLAQGPRPSVCSSKPSACMHVAKGDVAGVTHYRALGANISNFENGSVHLVVGRSLTLQGLFMLELPTHLLCLLIRALQRSGIEPISNRSNDGWWAC